MNPHLEIIPDFATNKHTPAHQRLADCGIAENLIIPTLEDIWRDNNAEQQELWDKRLRQKEQEALDAERFAAEEANLHHQAQKDKAALANQEEQKKKKNKNKYAPIPNVPIPTKPIFIPSLYAMSKMRKGEYCELYYFTNRRLAEAENTLPSLDDEALTLSQAENGTHSFISLSSVKAGASLVKDEDLTWEEFGQVNYRMLNAMCEYNWPEERIKMYIDLWLAIETHRWRHDTSAFGKKVLLIYQARA
ncbi:hypothetical protein PAXRUDRAFT_15324 [Paxillus rubicundulus Ve08.2h10]|uniref:Uncharacterized protein n=1 Tax=Paxillus rubicundulus Ve08.2h10 TaxID=930991 RepID=A0A0D0CEV4_9AGAM|nr:hypothetical protein PAXRUDRAFT_15324 [Paxillus rubicundulus Ve08.2h10]